MSQFPKERTEVVGKHGICKHNHNYNNNNNNNNTSSVSLFKTNNVIYTSSIAGSFSPVAVGAGSSPSSLCDGPKQSWQSAIRKL
jgi:hypothetical protein